MSDTNTLPDGTVLGNVPVISPGTLLRSRRELFDKKLHKALMDGIAPHGSSIVLSGGYVDDEDLGDVIIYTGEGGRKAKLQIADQRLNKRNLALVKIMKSAFSFAFTEAGSTPQTCQRDSNTGMMAFIAFCVIGRQPDETDSKSGAFS